jgi:hypothetical protein
VQVRTEQVRRGRAVGRLLRWNLYLNGRSGKGEGLQYGMAWSFASRVLWIPLSHYWGWIGLDKGLILRSSGWERLNLGISTWWMAMKSEGSSVGMAWNFVLEGYVVSLGLYRPMSALLSVSSGVPPLFIRSRATLCIYLSALLCSGNANA